MAPDTHKQSPPPPPPKAGGGGGGFRPTVLLVRPIYHFIEEPLAKSYSFLKPWESPCSMEDFLAAHAESVQVIVCTSRMSIDAAVISMLPRLELVVTASVGTDHIDRAECRRRGVMVANAGCSTSVEVADYAVGLFIDVLRRITAADRYVRSGLWATNWTFPLGSKLGGKRVGIIGLGSIGSKIAKRLEAFNCVIGYVSRSMKPYVPYKFFPDARKLAEWSDVLILSAALNDDTKHIVNRDVLEALGKRGVVINVGRGPLVDEKELVRSLKEGVIAGAGLDVFEKEPAVPPELLEMENVVLSPHNSVTTPESLADLVDLIDANLEAFFSNKPLLSLVMD